MLDFALAKAVELETESKGFDVSPEFNKLQDSYRAHRRTRAVAATSAACDVDNIFAKNGTTYAPDKIALAPLNIFR